MKGLRTASRGWRRDGVPREAKPAGWRGDGPRGVVLVMTLLALMAPARAHAERETIDRIVAVIEDEAIFESEVDQAVRQYLFQKSKSSVTPAERDALFKEALENLINDRLVIAQAAHLGIDVPFADVEAQVNKAIDENKRAIGGDEAFEQQLKIEGLTADELKRMYRTQIRNRMLVERVLQKDMARQKGAVTDEELKKFYAENKDRVPDRPEVVHLKTIFIGFETASGAASDALKKITALRDRIIAGADFGEVAKAESDDPSAPLGGDLGFLKAQDLSEPGLAAAAASLDMGQVSEPIFTIYGYHLVQITDRRPESGEVRLRHILVKATPSDQDIATVFKSATAIYEDIRQGVPFDSLATRYNTDPAADKHGDLGWLRVAELPQFFRDVLAGMKPDDVSQVLRETAGFRIVKLVERDAARPYEFSEIKDDLKRLYDQQKFASSYDEYIAELRKKFPVEMRM